MISEKVFKSGLRLIVHKKDTRAASVFVGVNVGSMNETDQINGISHFIEHMMFKGTKTRSAQQINVELESVGAHVNAFTSNSMTAFYASCIDENIEKCFEILSDMLLNSTFEEEEFNKERKVIYEEIDMYEDDPSSLAYETGMSEFFKGTPLEYKVIGTKEVLSKLTPKDLHDYVKKYYIPQNMVVSVSGGVNEKTIESLTQKYFEANYTQEEKSNLPKIEEKLFLPIKSSFLGVKKDVVQSNIVLMLPIANVYSSDRTAYNLAGFVLGGGMSSRLHERIRTKLAYVYTIHSLPDIYSLGGIMAVTFATNKEHEADAIKAIKQEFDLLAGKGIQKDEFEKAKTFYKSALILSEETVVNIARHNMTNVLTFGRYKSIDERIKEIDSVKLTRLNEIFSEMFNRNKVVGAVVSNKPETKIFAPLEK